MFSFAGKTHTKDQHRIWPLSSGAGPTCLPSRSPPPSPSLLYSRTLPCWVLLPQSRDSQVWSKTKSISIPGDLSGKRTLRLSPRLQDQELCGGGGGGGQVHLPMQQPSRGCVGRSSWGHLVPEPTPRPSLARAPHPSGLALILTSVCSLSTPFISQQPGSQWPLQITCSSPV